MKGFHGLGAFFICTFLYSDNYFTTFVILLII